MGWWQENGVEGVFIRTSPFFGRELFPSSRSTRRSGKRYAVRGRSSGWASIRTTLYHRKPRLGLTALGKRAMLFSWRWRRVPRLT
jgi:hypothetical protein